MMLPENLCSPTMFTDNWMLPTVLAKRDCPHTVLVENTMLSTW